MNPDHQFELEFDARSENEAFARQCVSGFLLRFDPTVSELADLRTAVSEAVTNSVVHAYRNSGKGKIYISVRTYQRKVVIRVKDFGCGMEDPELCRQPLYTTDPTGERGGMGFAIMESFTDRVKVKTAPGKGTTVTLIKNLS
ncbi:MAG: anti-sigma F factor [Clostridia bacterium]|nr:anti-sigma F factor [Clostridia bacterium]